MSVSGDIPEEHERREYNTADRIHPRRTHTSTTVESPPFPDIFGDLPYHHCGELQPDHSHLE